MAHRSLGCPSLLAALLLVCLLPVPALAQPADDVERIRAAALDYIEGWYAGNADRMARALHPELVKRIARQRFGGTVIEQMGARDLIELTSRNAGRPSSEPHRADVTVLDVFGDAASVRIDADAWIDYLHLARVDGQWKIVNVLWETRGERAN